MLNRNPAAYWKLGRKRSSMNRFFTALLVAPLAACVGTMDSLHAVNGKAPKDGTCEVRITETSTSRLVKTERVRGIFSVSYQASGPFPATVDIAAYCAGAKVRELKAISARNAGDINLGKIAP